MRIFLMPSIMLCAVVCGCSRPVKSVEELSPQEQIANMRDQAKATMLAECSNAVPGVRTIISADAITHGDSLVKWSGGVTLDYINHFGGVDRTNLQFVFHSVDGRLTCMMDYQYYFRRDQEDFSNHLARIRAGKE